MADDSNKKDDYPSTLAEFLADHIARALAGPRHEQNEGANVELRPDDFEARIRDVPKVELHIHLV